MNNNVICENCTHKDVCKYRDDFTDIQKQFNEVPMLKCTNFLERNVIYNKRSNVE